MKIKCLQKLYSVSVGIFASVAISGSGISTVYAESKWEVNGYIENQSRQRAHGIGLSKSRNTAQVEVGRGFGAVGIFRNFSFNGTFRGTYDAVYDLNTNDFGENAGGPISLDGGATNEGLKILGSDIHDSPLGVQLAVPVRPCDKDSRGCIKDYLDASENELKYPEFNDRWDFIREAYFTGDIPLKNGDQINVSLGRQQVVWGRTDLFRVLDVINPVDFSRNNIYDELEDIRIPMAIATAEYQAGATNTFDDLNFQLLWKIEKFRPNHLGQGGTPNAIIDAGSFFRAMHNCWENGCTVGNFPTPGGLAPVPFDPNVLGIRQANLPGWSLSDNDFGARLEGVFKGVGFSLNALRYTSHFPVLRGNIPSINPFDPTAPAADHPYLIAFDIGFPRITLIGGSADFYIEKIKSAFRIETAWTTGEEFANTIEPDLFSESDVLRYVIGWDRPTFIPFLNKHRAWLISAQLFGQHLLDHALQNGPGGQVGIPDYKDNWIVTLLLQGFYQNDQLNPQLLSAYDVRSQALAVQPSLDWLINNSWRLQIGANIKFGNTEEFDDNRSAAPFPQIGGPAGSTGMFRGVEPLGRFRGGPIGVGHNEDEIFATLRFRF